MKLKQGHSSLVIIIIIIIIVIVVVINITQNHAKQVPLLYCTSTSICPFLPESLETVIVVLFLDTHAAFLQVMSKVC